LGNLLNIEVEPTAATLPRVLDDGIIGDWSPGSAEN
jgi:hypothetical protein